MNLQHLHAPFPPNEIEWRVGSTKADKTSGLALAYLTARHVMERLDEVCGVGNWQDRYEFHGKRTVCYLSIRIDNEWVTKADGAGDSDVEAEKGAISDALKRAAVKWGIGRYLYALGNTWVDIEPAGRSFRIKRSEFPRLEKMMQDKFGLPPSDMGNINLAAAEVVETAPDQTAPPASDEKSKADSRDLYQRLSAKNRECKDLAAFNRMWNARNIEEAFDTLPKDWRQALADERGDKFAELDERAAISDGYVPPQFSSDPHPEERAMGDSIY